MYILTDNLFLNFRISSFNNDPVMFYLEMRLIIEIDRD